MSSFNWAAVKAPKQCRTVFFPILPEHSNPPPPSSSLYFFHFSFSPLATHSSPSYSSQTKLHSQFELLVVCGLKVIWSDVLMPNGNGLKAIWDDEQPPMGWTEIGIAVWAFSSIDIDVNWQCMCVISRIGCVWSLGQQWALMEVQWW